MSTNRYFQNFNSFPQQELINGLTREVIEINGTDVIYLPRKLINRDDILNEDSSNVFNSAFEIEMYINSNEGFAGAGDIISKFGLDVQDEIGFIVHKERFIEESKLPSPKEGDLIYLYMSKTLFDIKFVEHEKPFYSMGKNQVFELTCEKFQYSNEKFLIPAAQKGDIFDKIVRSYSTKTTLTLADTAGDYVIGEVVSQLGVQGIIASYDPVTFKIYLYNVLGGIFLPNEQLIGSTSGTSKNVVSVRDQELSDQKDSYDENITFETEGDSILDFSEIDPWAEGDL
tara:strand:+ start:117 stop:971 length:855 start_codon:yes stop_codon:yes gene_type:complete